MSGRRLEVGLVVFRSLQTKKIKGIEIWRLPVEPPYMPGTFPEVVAQVSVPILEEMDGKRVPEDHAITAAQTLGTETMKKRLRTDSTLVRLYGHVWDAFQKGQQKPALDVEVVDNREWRRIMQGGMAQ